jgi:hypothetical protein
MNTHVYHSDTHRQTRIYINTYGRRLSQTYMYTHDEREANVMMGVEVLEGASNQRRCRRL